MSIHSRTNPFHAIFRERSLLNGPGSTKQTYHIVLDISHAPFPFQVGDSIGIYPDNDSQVVDAILQLLHCQGDEPYLDQRSNTTFTVRDFLLKKANLAKCTSALLKLLGDRGTEDGRLVRILLPENKADLLAFLQTHHLIDILQAFPKATLSAQDVCSTLLPLMPRFYSIASSPQTFPKEIHLTVASLRYETVGGARYGVGSHFLCNVATPATPIPLFLQPSNGFTIPTNPHAPIILIGPGTGIAPFRGFLQERRALQHPGRNWLFFGERNQATDFYYADYWFELQKQGHLQFDTAFSRDRADKLYVQHRIWDHRACVWDWIQQGAYIYVCGDAEKMAKDVEATFVNIGCDQGAFTPEKSREWMKALRKERRYLQDVY